MNDPNTQSDLDRLEQLASEKYNGSLDRDGYAELQRLLAQSGDLRTAYWQMNAIHADLEWGLFGKEASHDEVKSHLPEEDVVESATIGASQGRSVKLASRRSWGTAIAAGIAAIVLSGWTLWYLIDGEQSSQIAELVRKSSDAAPTAAKLTSLTSNSRWSFGRPGDRNPRDFDYGDTVWVEEGLVEMRLEEGVVGQLRAPVILQLLSQNRVRLLSGKIRVNAPAQANRFTVETPSAEVVDLGTEFSVEAAETGTDLVVFDGKVDLKVSSSDLEENSTAGRTWHFTTGQAVHVDLDGTLSRIMQVRSSARPLESDAPSASPVIASVVDNVIRDDYWTFYGIVQGGMAEDAQVYVDRPHEWNGLTESGMPGYLVGGDYIKTFNDDKITEDLKLKVTISQPAVLYVLLDDRVSPPAWLTESFTKTGDQIGIDEAPHVSKDHTRYKEGFIEVGPGNSIDSAYSIWKKVLPEAETVLLGSNGTVSTRNKRGRDVRGIHASMYGIVAVPLEDVEKPGL